MRLPPNVYVCVHVCVNVCAPSEPRVLTPRVPAWKGNDDAEDAADAANEDAGTEEDGGAAGAGGRVGPRVCLFVRRAQGGKRRHCACANALAHKGP